MTTHDTQSTTTTILRIENEIAPAVYSVADAHAATVSCKICFQHSEASAC
jgi:hypothetical protein